MKRHNWDILTACILAIAITVLAVSCVTTRLPYGIVINEPADGVVAGLEAAIAQAVLALAEAQTDYERDTIAARLTKLRNEVEAWRLLVKDIKGAK